MLIRRSKPSLLDKAELHLILERMFWKEQSRRRAMWKTTNKRKFTLIGSPLGQFEAWMESANSLPLVIRGEAGHFNINGTWIKAGTPARV